jgi:hypothetical protein
LQTAQNYTTGKPDGANNRGASLFNVDFSSEIQIFNSPENEVGESSEQALKSSLTSPTFLSVKGTSKCFFARTKHQIQL